ncbi:MAG: DUF302 domain-containing protein [Sulfuriferula sp.]|nr:DUF302 domain-containing protein [Sulfuriferula sp.]
MKLMINRLVGPVVIGFAMLMPLAHAADTTTKKPAVTSSAMPGVYKVPLAKGVSMDDAVESMKLRANALNIKLVAELPLSSQVEAMIGGKQRRIAIYQFCDALTAKDLVDMNVDFAIFLPCRIALVEDKTGQAWLVMMDMDVKELAKTTKMTPELEQKITKVRNGLIEIVNAGANGDL